MVSSDSADGGRQLELLQIKRWVGDTTFDRGLDYADRDKVAEPARAGEVLTAEIEGSIPRGGDEPAQYRVQVDLEPPVPRATCTCPVRAAFCKHAAALLITWERAPEDFAVAEEGEAAPAEPEAAPKPKTSKAARQEQVRLEELDAVARMIRDLAGDGIAGRGRHWVDDIPDMLAKARQRRYLRLAASLEAVRGEMIAPASGEGAFDPARWVDLLADLWFTSEATRQYVAGRGAGERALERLVGKAPREAGLARRYEVGLLELAYEAFGGPLGTRLDVSYLMDLNSGELFVERVVVPASRARRAEPKPSYDVPLLAKEMGVYPGYPPPRVALITVQENELPLEDAISRALGFAESSLLAIHERLVQLAGEPFASREAFALLKVDGILEQDGQLHLLDAEGRCVPVAECPPGHPPTLEAFEAYAHDEAPTAVFVRFFVGDDAGMRAAPLSIVEAPGVVRLAVSRPPAS